MDKIDLSLDELIKKNKQSKKIIKTKNGSSSPKKLTGRKPVPGVKRLSPKKKPVLDARTKIIQNNRHKIRDARERIAENVKKNLTDARVKLSRENPNKTLPRLKKAISIPRSRSAGSNKLAPGDELMDVVDFDMEDLDSFKLKPVGSIKRTVHNEMFRAPPKTMPKLPHFSISQDAERLSPTADPFDCYVVPTRRPIPVPPVRQERIERYQPGRIMSAHMDAYGEPRKNILRSNRDEHDDRFEGDRYEAPRYTASADGVRSRLYNDPRDRNESAGIFANLPSNRAPSPPSSSGYRIIVSNLNSTVTDSDVRELFEDVGPLLQSHLVRPGIAEIVYKNLSDAEEAVETYHNRQLDGHPMKCMLVKSRNSKPSSVYGRISGSDRSDLEMDVVHRALFRR